MVPLKQRVDKQQVEWLLEGQAGGAPAGSEEDETQAADR